LNTVLPVRLKDSGSSIILPIFCTIEGVLSPKAIPPVILFLISLFNCSDTSPVSSSLYFVKNTKASLSTCENTAAFKL